MALSDTIEEDVDPLPDVIVVTDVLDLHGTPMSIIPDMLEEFMANAIRLKLQRVQIIHGKGKSRLKHLVIRKLEGDPRVAAYYDAPPHQGGWGRTIAELEVDK